MTPTVRRALAAAVVVLLLGNSRHSGCSIAARRPRRAPAHPDAMGS